MNCPDVQHLAPPRSAHAPTDRTARGRGRSRSSQLGSAPKARAQKAFHTASSVFLSMETCDITSTRVSPRPAKKVTNADCACVRRRRPLYTFANSPRSAATTAGFGGCAAAAGADISAAGSLFSRGSLLKATYETLLSILLGPTPSENRLCPESGPSPLARLRPYVRYP